MERVNLKITSSDTNAKKTTSTINYVNGSLSMGDYYDIATATIGLTSMTYISSQLVRTIDIDELASTRNVVKPTSDQTKSVSPFARK